MPSCLVSIVCRQIVSYLYLETHLAYFGKNSDGECDVIIATNPLNPDAEQPFTIDRVKMDSSVDSDCKVFIQSPGLS